MAIWVNLIFNVVMFNNRCLRKYGLTSEAYLLLILAYFTFNCLISG